MKDCGLRCGLRVSGGDRSLAASGQATQLVHVADDLDETAVAAHHFRSVPALIAAIEDYLQHYNAAPERFVWTKSADLILHKLARCPKASNA